MNSIGFIGGLSGPGEVLVLVIVILVLFFGARKLPELARAIGKSIGEFKKGQKEGAEEEKKKDDETPNAQS